MRRWAPIFFGIVFFDIAGCAHGPGPWRQDSSASECIDVVASIDRAVDKAGVGDAEYARVKGFPYFRIDRFLASYNFAGFDADQRTAWIDRLVVRDLEARAIEIGNLPLNVHQSLTAALGQDPLAAATECSATLRRFDHGAKEAHKALPFRATVGDDYSFAKRAAGLYPITAPFVKMGFSSWKRENLVVFERPPDTLAVAGSLVSYEPEGTGRAVTRSDISAMVGASRTNPLDLPEPKGNPARRLIRAFAPVWIVDQTSEQDRIGKVVRSESASNVGGSPQTYTRFSHVYFDGSVLLQISYMVWFPSRPPESSGDPLAGHLDGVIWRVTIGADGAPLLYDTIHPCGCYHLFFPSEKLHLRKGMEGTAYYEGTIVAAPAPGLATGGRVAIRIAAGSHYVVGVAPWAGGTIRNDSTTTYALANYHELRSLPIASGSKSLFEPNGMIAGTERRERKWLWVTGIKSPGAMRQWGHHATAFVGKRHFDDPWLIIKNFESAGPAQNTDMVGRDP